MNTDGDTFPTNETQRMTAVHARWTVAGGVTVVVGACWIWIIAMAWDMYGPMTGASSWMMIAQWDWLHSTLLFAMWSVMMTAMMLPTAAPMLLQHAKRIPVEPGAVRPELRVSAIAAGYVIVWMMFSVGATIVQRVMSEVRLLTPMMEPARSAIAGGLLLTAGLYQLLPYKRACLVSCRSSVACVAAPCTGVIAALRAGTQYGLDCLGCCWALMLLLFAGGVMNLAVIGAVTLIVLFEKVSSLGMRSTRITGGLLIALGVWFLAR
jgi:predicted metal-binding membrane protein